MQIEIMLYDTRQIILFLSINWKINKWNNYELIEIFIYLFS